MIKVCPACRYSLCGLPEKYTCPECGFRYDRNACIFARPRLGLVVLVAVHVAMFVIGVVLWWWLGQGLAPFLFISAGLMGSLTFVWRLRRCRRFILVSGDELRVFDCRHQEELFPMDRVVDAEWSRVGGEVVIAALGERGLIVIPFEFLGSHRRSKRLVSTIRRHLSAK